MKEITNPNSVVWLPRKRKLIFFFLFRFFPGAKREQIEYNNKIKKKKTTMFSEEKKYWVVFVYQREREQKNRMENCFWVGTRIFGERERERERERDRLFVFWERRIIWVQVDSVGPLGPLGQVGFLRWGRTCGRNVIMKPWVMLCLYFGKLLLLNTWFGRNLN